MWVETSELVHSMANTLDSSTLLVAVSQSGRSAEVVRLLDHEKTPGFTIGVTNDPGSPVARGADLTLLLHAGAEHSVSCKTYVASLAVLRWLGGAILGDDLREVDDELARIEPSMGHYLSGWRSHAASLLAQTRRRATPLRRRSRVFARHGGHRGPDPQGIRPIPRRGDVERRIPPRPLRDAG